MPARTALAAKRAAHLVRARLADDLLRLMADGGISQERLSAAAGVAQSQISRTLSGQARPSLETYAKLAAPLGADLSARLYPNTGPTLRDRHQAPILEWLLGLLHPRWQPFTEAAVTKPSRGWIDAVLHEARARLPVATEIESGLQRLEQLVRWSQDKAAALPSWPGWQRLEDEPQISRLLIVRRTRATRQVASDFARQLVIAYPAHPDDAMAALIGTAPWPGPALVWVRHEATGVRFVPGR
jgi:transcriptional regulator with XRE-family HTH domain